MKLSSITALALTSSALALPLDNRTKGKSIKSELNAIKGSPGPVMITAPFANMPYERRYGKRQEKSSGVAGSREPPPLTGEVPAGENRRTEGSAPSPAPAPAAPAPPIEIARMKGISPAKGDRPAGAPLDALGRGVETAKARFASAPPTQGPMVLATPGNLPTNNLATFQETFQEAFPGGLPEPGPPLDPSSPAEPPPQGYCPNAPSADFGADYYVGWTGMLTKPDVGPGAVKEMIVKAGGCIHGTVPFEFGIKGLLAKIPDEAVPGLQQYGSFWMKGEVLTAVAWTKTPPAQ